MPISVNDIVVGKCYVTATHQLRRVLKVENGKVSYEERSKTEFAGSSLSRTTVGAEKFARGVERQVPCD